MVFITISASLAVYFIHRFASHALRRARLGLRFFRLPSAQRSIPAEASRSDPPRFRHAAVPRRDHLEMPAPGDHQPARLRLNCMIWSGRGYINRLAERSDSRADRLNRLQFLTIRRYLSLVFATLVTLLLVLAIWS